jgi:SPX domain protein involved in polyphosphate accumulation
MIRLQSILSGVLSADTHNGINGYVVRSLYFDSFAETDYYAKMSSDDNRKKIRLRTYNYDSENPQLELKRKENSNQKKDIFFITRETAKSLIECNYDVLYGRNDTEPIYNIMKLNRVRPVALVEYRRLAFIHPACNVRITFDTKIKSSESNFDIFRENVVLNPVDLSDAGVVEIKYEDFLPAWLGEIISEYVLERTAYSKYTASRNLFAQFLA